MVHWFARSRDCGSAAHGIAYVLAAGRHLESRSRCNKRRGRLAGRGFFKAHRAYLVNLQRIKAIIQYTRNSYTLQLNDKQETMIPLSKQSEKELQDLLGY